MGYCASAGLVRGGAGAGNRPSLNEFHLRPAITGGELVVPSPPPDGRRRSGGRDTRCRRNADNNRPGSVGSTRAPQFGGAFFCPLRRATASLQGKDKGRPKPAL